MPLRVPFIMPLPLAIVLALIAWVLSQLHQLPFASVSKGVALILAVCGVAVIAVAFIQFRIHRTSPHPRQFSNNLSLLSTGVFAYSRNPIYLGMLIFLVAWALFCADGLALIAPIIFFIWINFWQVAVEEFHLQRQFGEAYYVYCSRVRRWL